ncbi:ATP-binding protein [Dactylosporangium sp. CA-092794]|uniref:ATP-binding protein n=1 Tax=Dactylosporangium sp. CA-092794 TaxID=3239929 RepID=UPI003D902581
MFRGTGPATGAHALGGPERPVSAQPAPDVDSPFLGLFDEPPGGPSRDRLRALEPGRTIEPGRAEGVRPISGIPISAAPSSGAPRAPEDLRAPKRAVPRTPAEPLRTNGERLSTRPVLGDRALPPAPERTPARAPERTPPRVPERTPPRVPDRMPPRAPERAPARVPERPVQPGGRPGGAGTGSTPRKNTTAVTTAPPPPARRAEPARGLPAQQPPRPPRMVPPPRGRTPLDRTPKPRQKDRSASIDLAITEIAGHLTFTPNTVTAWYWLPEVRWSFRPDAEREALLSAISEQYAGLAGFRLHLRRTTRPFAADQWARVVDANTPRPLPTAGGPSWADHLVAAQKHLLSINHAEGQTYLGIAFARRTLGDTFTERIGALFKRGVADAERRRMARTVEQFDEVLGAFGMRGRRVTSFELEWLLYRSVALGMSPPGNITTLDGGWDAGDLLALTEAVERYRTPYGSTVKLVNRVTGEERHVAVLTVGRMEPLEIPERHEPWLHFHERLPWPMEISSRIDILGPGDSFRNLEHRLRLIRSQQADYSEHGIDAPPELERLAKRALTIGDEISTGLPVDSSRAHGWHRIAIGGRTREECLERARRVTQMYSREMRIALQHPKNQDWMAREFIPGEPLANTGYLRRMPVKLFAAALPQAASTVGDRRGDLIGRTAGTSRRPVFLDLHFPMEVRERSGLAVFVAEPGGGKSTLMGALGYLAARRGVQVTLLDPSGPLARLCSMPELAPYARVLNLTGSEQGTLAPYALIPTPQRGHYTLGPAGDREFEIAVSNARAERRMLVQDICMMLVPPQVAREASTATMLRHAVRQVPAEESSTLEDVIRSLRDTGDHDAMELGNLLLDTAEMPLAMLFFGSPPPGLLGPDAALTVITMAGLRLPDLKIEREYWSAEESLALPMLHTAHRLAVRRCYGGDMSTRKLVGLDEAHFMEGWRSGRSFLVRLARDSRKWNLAALVASQNPKDILGLDVQNLVSTVFVGRIAEDSEIAAEALRLLRVPTDVGYEQTLAALSQVDTSSSSRLGFREFVMRDVDGRVQKVRVDVSYVPDLLRYLDTTPGGATTAGTVGGEVVDVHDDDPEDDR